MKKHRIGRMRQQSNYHSKLPKLIQPVPCQHATTTERNVVTNQRADSRGNSLAPTRLDGCIRSPYTKRSSAVFLKCTTHLHNGRDPRRTSPSLRSSLRVKLGVKISSKSAPHRVQLADGLCRCQSINNRHSYATLSQLAERILGTLSSQTRRALWSSHSRSLAPSRWPSNRRCPSAQNPLAMVLVGQLQTSACLQGENLIPGTLRQ